MAYVRTTWVDGAAGATPVDAANLNNLEAGLVTADANATSALTNAPSAAVVKSTVTTAGDLIYATGSAAVTRLALGAAGTVLKGGASAPSFATIVNADVDAAAAIAYSKLNLAASVATADMAAGNKRSVSSLAGGPPASPATGDIWVATSVDANGTAWQFCYNSAETTYKWEFIGGPPVLTSVSVTETVNSATYIDLATVGPSFTTARAGDYLIRFAATFVFAASTSRISYVSPKIGAAAASDSNAASMTLTTLAAQTIDHVCQNEIVATTAAADVVKLQYRGNAADATQTARARWMSVVPRRII